MNATIEDLRGTIVPKSDQLNAEQLLAGPMTITVSDVRLGSGEEQPVIVHYQGEDGRPYKPCKTMRKVLILAWGKDGREWVGRSLTLYNDPDVKFGGESVGGIRISHLSDIPQNIDVSLTATRGKKAKYKIRRLELPIVGMLSAIRSAETVEALKVEFGAAYKATRDTDARAQLKTAYDKRLGELSATTFDRAAYIDRINACQSLATLQIMSDDVETMPEGEDKAVVMAALLKRDGELAAAGVRE